MHPYAIFRISGNLNMANASFIQSNIEASIVEELDEDWPHGKVTFCQIL